MLKKDVWELFKAHAGGTIHDEWRFVGAEADELCGAIAQAAEEERRQQIDADAQVLGTTIKNKDGATADLRAQVAVMAEALGTCQELIDDLTSEASAADAVTIEGVVSIIQDALSAAPKVLWHGKAVLGRTQLLGWDNTVLRQDTTIRPLSKHVGTSIGTILGEGIGEDGQQVEVFVMECPRARGQEQSTEQAQESEQEEPCGT